MPFIPDIKLHKLTELTPEFLISRGIKFLMLDMDNTISPYRVDEPDEQTLKWAQDMKKAGITLYIVSNSKRVGRTEKFAQALDVKYIKHARKPSPKGAKIAMLEMGFMPTQSALCGDQIYTDVICANLAGCTSIVVYPIKFTNVFLRLRYYAELPFRIMRRYTYAE